MIKNQIILDLLNDNGGKLPAWSPVGGYSYLYVDQRNDIHCPNCANLMLEDEDTEICQVHIHWEGEPMVCDCCGDILPSEYGNPEEE